MMKNLSKLTLISLLTLILVLIQGCSPTKKLFKKTDPYQHIQQVMDKHTSFNLLESKVNINFKSPQGSNSLAAQVRIKRDSCLWVSLQPFLGIEVGRLFLTPDSIFIMNRLQRIYATASLQDNYIGSDQAAYALKALTAVLSNQLFVPGSKKARAQDFIMQRTGGEIVLSSAKGNEKVDFHINKAGEYYRSVLQSSFLESPVQVEYSLFQATHFGSFPNRMAISFIQADQETALRIDYLKPVYNTNLSFDFPIPGNYKQTTIEYFLEQLQF